MADEQDGGQASAPGRDDGGPDLSDLLSSRRAPGSAAQRARDRAGRFAERTHRSGEDGAAAVTGSASILAEAAHSWADAGNEVFLLIANRRSRRPPDPAHPFGHGREAYVWSLFAALGLFVAGAAVSITHGVQELITPEPASNFVVGYAVLAFSFVFESISPLQSVRQAR
jgi:hypothetical protein